jgi:hypothetical protein
MSPRREKPAEPAMSELQSFQMHQAVKALERCDAVCRSISVYARFTQALAGEGRIEEMEKAVWDLGVLADTASWLQMDASDALTAAFPDIRWNYWCGEGGP